MCEILSTFNPLRINSCVYVVVSLASRPAQRPVGEGAARKPGRTHVYVCMFYSRHVGGETTYHTHVRGGMG